MVMINKNNILIGVLRLYILLTKGLYEQTITIFPNTTPALFWYQIIRVT